MSDDTPLNPLSVADTLALTGDDLTDEAQDALDALLEAMNSLTLRQRCCVYNVLSDFFCLGCGIDQPPGDCQCRSSAQAVFHRCVRMELDGLVRRESDIDGRFVFSVVRP